MADSRHVAVFFGKRHDDGLRAIRNLIAQEPNLGIRDFADTPCVNNQNGKTYPTFLMTRDGFTLLAMGFTGEKAARSIARPRSP
nr:Rha family transcriptional regulator [Chelatococcus sp. HY11]